MRYATTEKAKIQWLSEGSFILSICFTKISVLLFFRRLEPSCSIGLKRIIFAFMTFTAVAGLSDLIVLVIQCRPIRASWTMPDGTQQYSRTCISKQAYYPAQGLIAGFSTAYTIIIPVLVLRNIPMTQLQRTGLRWITLMSLRLVCLTLRRNKS